MTTRDDRPSDRRLSAVWLAAGVLLLCGLGLAHATSAMIVAGDGQASTPPRTYRVLTYNVQFRPPALNDNSAYNMLSELRAEHTASAILAGGYDIVALNEVFHEGARDVLLNRLAPHYQVVFDRIQSDNGITGQDSGLMFFSKFPLADLSTPPGDECEYVNYDVPSPACRLASHMFSYGIGGDWYANKSIAVVRLNNPVTNRPVNVFFTHLQASIDGREAESAQVRATQIAEAKAFIEQWAPASGTSGQDVLLMGDLNIVGAPNDDESTDEYSTQVAGSGGFGGLELQDAYTLSADPFSTFDGARNIQATGVGRRLDYILHRDAVGTPRCIQHLAMKRDFQTEFGSGSSYVNTDLSDHYAVSALIGPVTPYCAPHLARQITSDGDYQQAIAQPGVVQWLRFDEPGTYSFKVSNPSSPMSVDAFAASDLSTPLTPYQGSRLLTTTQKVAGAFSNRVVFAVDEPFLIRVGAVDPFMGDYVLRSHKHVGASFDDAIALDPFTPLDQQQLAASAPSTVYYSLIQHRLHSGARQQLTFTTTKHLNARLRLRLFDAARQPLPGAETGYAAGSQTLHLVPGYASGQTPTPIIDKFGGSVVSIASPVNAEQQRLYLTVDNVDCNSSCSSSYNVSWKTNYRQLELRKMFILDKADVTNPDDVTMLVSVDGGPETAIASRGDLREGGQGAARYVAADRLHQRGEVSVRR